MERARLIIERCAHPDYRDCLRGYLKQAAQGHQPFSMRAFGMHESFLRDGTMRNVTW